MSYPLINLFKALKNTLNLERVIASGNSIEAARLVPFMYYFMTFIAFMNLEGLNHLISNPRGELSPRWPIFWAGYFDQAAATSAIIIFFVISSLIAAVFYRNILARVLAFLGFLQFHAFNSSFGYPNHQWDVWLWVSFIFIFFPNIWSQSVSEATKKKFLLVFWAAQAYLLMTYSMSGLGKIYDSVWQALAGEAHSFSLDAAALHVSTLLYSLQQSTPLGPLIVEHPWLGWIPFVGIIYLEFFSLYVAFTPSLHRIWGVGLVLFHMGTYLAMRAIFVSPVPLLLLLLLSSPFPGKPGLAPLIDLPLFGKLARLFIKKI